jgi:hypothetical protein
VTTTRNTEPSRVDAFVHRNALAVVTISFATVLIVLALIGPYLPGVPRP